MHINCHLTARSEIGKIFNSNNYGGKRIIVVQFIASSKIKHAKRLVVSVSFAKGISL